MTVLDVRSGWQSVTVEAGWIDAEVSGMGMWSRSNGREVPNERHWSAHTSTSGRNARADLVPYTPLPAETGPLWAPDQLSVWPMEGGRYGIDAHYHGRTGVERAHVQQSRLQKQGLDATVKRDTDGGLIRIGPLAHAAAWLALEAFLGRPL
ncbi:MAG TPA: hypothetical protein VKV21_03100 [Solirubrobacteraceae bacterium]|nr:hypothetical protein [Solirubrobacteraceae bacterium]